MDLTTEMVLPAVAGGILIGAGASALLLLNGRVLGISGIVAGVVRPVRGDTAWRVAAVAGLVSAGLALLWLMPAALPAASTSWWRYVVAGLLVGVGSQLGSGCTSGHGICGISRFSPRSILATAVFTAVGALTVMIVRALGGWT